MIDLAFLSQLTAGLSHEINNHLMVILGSSRKAQKKVEEGELEEARELFERIEQRSQKIAELIKGIRKFSVIESNENYQFSPFESLCVIEGKFSYLFPKAKLIWEDRSAIEDLSIAGDSSKFEEMIFKVLENAYEAVCDQKRAKVILTTELKDSHFIIQIKDNGVGVQEYHIGKLYDPFYTVNERPGKLGLGLTTCFNILRFHFGGMIDCTSKPGEGCLFTLQIPVS